MSATVPQRLIELAELFRTRNAVYGNDYKRHGAIMTVLFPNGLTLKTENDFTRYALYQYIISKAARYAANFTDGGHEDSLDDISVYAQMLQEVDAIAREEKG